MPRKWIAQRIAELDPDVDYDEIWKLSSCYRPTEFTMNLIYAVSFVHFLVREADALPVYNGGHGKLFTDPDKRADDTSWKMQHWWHHGATSDATRKSVDAVNRLHAHYAKQFPDSFGFNDAYLYTLCYEAAGMHRLLQRVGLPGLTENEQRAAVNYWSRIMPLFRNIGTGEPVSGFPATFQGVLDWMDAYEADTARVARHDMGPEIVQAVIDQFAAKYFPRPLHPAASAWVRSLYPDFLIEAYGLQRPSRVTRRTFRLLTAVMFAAGEKVLPDPTDTYTDRRRARRAADGADDTLRAAQR